MWGPHDWGSIKKPKWWTHSGLKGSQRMEVSKKVLLFFPWWLAREGLKRNWWGWKAWGVLFQGRKYECGYQWARVSLLPEHCSRRRVSVEPGRGHPGLQSSVESTFGRDQAGEMAVDTLGLQARCCRSVALCVVSAWKASGDSTVC